MKTAVVGGRDFNDAKLLFHTLDNLAPTPSEIISGGARGADSWAASWAKSRGVRLVVHKPDWERYGKAAGFQRNKLIVLGAERVVAFWDGRSKGTAHTISAATAARLPLLVVPYGRSTCPDA